MSDKASTSVSRNSASVDEEPENVLHQREMYERLQAEMSIPSTSGMASSSGAIRKRPRKMKVEEQIAYNIEIEKTNRAAGKVAAKFDDSAVAENQQKSGENTKQIVVNNSHLVFAESSSSDLDLEKTSTPVQSMSGGVKRKRSHLLLGRLFDENSLEWNDDAEERRMSELQKEWHQNKSLSKDDCDSTLMKQIAQMSTEELADRVFNCMRLCAENKINVRNAFSLHLIDWLPELLKQKNSLTENFSTLACTLDASAKIYSHRVDIVHKEVMKLAEMLAPNGKNNKKSKDDDLKSKDDPSPQKRKKTTIVANPAVLLRKRNGRNPLHKFVKVGAHAGDLMNAMLKTRKTFSTDTPFKPVPKKVRSRGKLVSLKIKSYRRLSQLDHHSLSKIHGHFLSKSRRGMKPRASFIHDDYDRSDIDTETDCNVNDLSMVGLLAEFEEHTPEPQKNVLDVICQKVEESNLLDNPRQFKQLSRVEKLSLVLNSEPDSFVNKDLEMLLYGPMHLRRLQRVERKRIAAGKGKKKITVEFLDFSSKSDKNLKQPVETQQKSKDGKQKPKKCRQRIIRTELTLRTLNNWSLYKYMLPEEIIVNTNYMQELILRDDFDVKEKVIGEHEKLLSLENDDNWEDMEIEITYGHADEDDQKKDIKKDKESSEVDDQGYKGSEFKYNKDNQDFEIEGEKENHEDKPEGFIDFAFELGTEDDSSDDEDQEGPAAESTSVTEHQDDSDSSMCSLVEAPVIVKVQELKYSTRSSRVNMRRLKGAIKDILDEGPLGNKENAGEGTSSRWPDESEGAVALPPPNEEQPVMFADVLSELPARLDSSSAEDLTPQMAFLALLHVASENNLMLTNDETSDVVITKMKESDTQNPDENDDQP